MRSRRAQLIDPADPAQVDRFYANFRPTIPVDRALLCLDCDSIFEAENDQRCPSCGSSQAYMLSRIINRKAS